MQGLIPGASMTKTLRRGRFDGFTISSPEPLNEFTIRTTGTAEIRGYDYVYARAPNGEFYFDRQFPNGLEGEVNYHEDGPPKI